MGMIVGVYGIGYLIAARDPRTHWPIVLVGLLGKVFGPIGFVALLAVLYALVIRYGRSVWHKFPTHTIGGIISTATLFAAVHSAVWPSPVPLFFLGCALGYVVVRSGGITASVVLHGLFNAVSTVYLIRGGAGLG